MLGKYFLINDKKEPVLGLDGKAFYKRVEDAQKQCPIFCKVMKRENKILENLIDKRRWVVYKSK